MPYVESVAFSQGMGEGPDVWDAQCAAAPSGFEGVAVDVFDGAGSGMTSAFSFEGAATLVVNELERLGIEQAHVCGLSLGAMIALQLTLDHPKRVRSMTPAAGQVKLPKVLMAVQPAVMRVLPSSVFERQDATEEEMLLVLRAVGRVDLPSCHASHYGPEEHRPDRPVEASDSVKSTARPIARVEG